ncbi:MAG TPA: glutaminyl-peptide cyclotransferase, partial [Puia sp.]|nr:glutaminyl-peptide cyclotransferase [Puia sp.]
MRKHFISVLLGLVLLFSCKDSSSSSENSSTAAEPSANNETPAITYTVLNVLPHDTSSYTEGFLVHDGKIFESS